MAKRRSRGLADVVAASTAVSDVDGDGGRLCYRGYDIGVLAGASTFEEVACLLQRGSLPSRGELEGYRAELAAGAALGDLVADALPAAARAQEPMAALRTLVSLASAGDPDAGLRDPTADLRKAARLTAQQPVLVAACLAARAGRKAAEADPAAGLAASLLHQLTGAVPAPRAAQIFDACLVLHADHMIDAATFAARLCAATMSDMHSAVVAALSVFKGPLHGGACEQVMHSLEQLRRAADPVAAVTAEMTARLERGERIAGFGHRAYRAEDPRTAPLRRMCAELAGETGDDTFYRMARRAEEIVFAAAGLHPNSDLYAAVAYHYLGIPAQECTAVRSVSRMAGWTAHVIEQHADNRLVRPSGEYVGATGLHWVPLEQR